MKNKKLFYKKRERERNAFTNVLSWKHLYFFLLVSFQELCLLAPWLGKKNSALKCWSHSKPNELRPHNYHWQFGITLLSFINRMWKELTKQPVLLVKKNFFYENTIGKEYSWIIMRFKIKATWCGSFLCQ